MNAHARANRNALDARIYARNLRALWEAADDKTRAAGHAWYAAAQRECAAIAAEVDLPLASVAGAMAALSPRTRWNENVADTGRLARWYVALRDDPDGPDVPLSELRRDLHAVSMAQVEKAVDALGAPDPLGAGILRGPKERAFCANILGDPDQVTVDVWMMRAASAGKRDAPTAREYIGVQDAVRALARKVGDTPANVQAAVWVQMRGRAS